MLTRELLLYKCAGGRITPRFLSPDNSFLTLADSLLSVYREAAGKQWTRAVLEDNIEPLLKAAVNNKIPAGMNKLLSDHCRFISGCGELDLSGIREEIFKRSAIILQNPPEDIETYRREVLNFTGAAGGWPQTDLYGDLPEFDRLEQVPPWQGAELCNIYNIAQVQGLLMYADKLELTINDSEPMVLRKFVRRLKFYRLLAHIEKKSGSEMKLSLSGPGAILTESRKYGLQLAAFFPVILLLKKWKIRAEVKLRENRPADILSLNSGKCELKSTLRRWVECVPDEVRLFIDNFRLDSAQWQLAPEADLPEIPGQGAFFPDFAFVHSAAPDVVIHVELFHRYHAVELRSRLDFLQQHPEYPLLLGVDRGLTGKQSEVDFLTQYPDLAEHIFFFSNYPGSNIVRKKLQQMHDYLAELP